MIVGVSAIADSAEIFISFYFSFRFLIQGDGECGFLSDNGISSSRDYIPRKWICSRSSNYMLQC
jgi:hypothetical protein